MGQKVHPKGLRLGIIHTWESNWIADARDYSRYVKEDFQIRTFLTKKLKASAVSRIEIDRKAQRLIIRIITGRPGMVVGRGGQGLDTLRKELQALTKRKDIQLDVIEVARIDMEAKLVAESIAQQLEKRAAYRRTMKQAIQRAMRSGAKGIKVMIAGRLGGAEIARSEWSKEGRIPLHTFRADIDYGVAEATTMFGIIGIKVWIFKGEVMPGEKASSNIKQKNSNAEEGDSPQNQGLRGAGRRGDNRGGRGPGGGQGQGPQGRGGGGRGRGNAPQGQQQHPQGQAPRRPSPDQQQQQPQAATQVTPPEAPAAETTKPSEE
ncbi:MAG: 30S ribosomal protein S3 [Cyanobacteria bacterium]|nr:30S ribosomal protein S3 [Cyanobacteriota bacterium]